MPRLTPHERLKRKVRAILDLCEERGIAVGSVRVEIDDEHAVVTITEKGQDRPQQSGFDQWKARRAG